MIATPAQLVAVAGQPAPVEDWREKRKRRILVTSATQYESFDHCKRQWWLSQVRKLPQPKSGANIFGSVLHSVLERFLCADELGRDTKTGQPVDLYPHDWYIAWDKWKPGEIEGSIGPAEQDQVKKLVAKAIEDGILQRTPWRMIERDFRRTVIQLACATCGGCGYLGQQPDNTQQCPECGGDGNGTHVQIQGFIDVMEADGLQDHKSTKSMRYAKSPAALRENAQMLIYAKQYLEEFRANGWHIPPRIKLRHNVYCKDPENPIVRKTEVDVTPEEVDHFWETRIVENAKSMERLRRTVERWDQVPDPHSLEVCNAYGGCAYRSICGGRESEAGYEQRLARFKVEQSGQQTAQLTVNGTPPYTGPNHSPLAKGSAMGFDAKLAERRAAVGQAVAPGQINPPQPQGGYAPAPQQAPPQQGYPPQPPPFQGQPPQGQYPPQQPPQGQYPPQQPPPQQQYPQQPPPQQVFAPPQPAPPQAPPQQISAPAPAQVQQTLTTPPWVDQACKACGGWGFNTVGGPCRICDHTAQQQGRPVSGDFQIQALGNGTVYWQKRDGTQNGGYSPLPNQGAPGQAEQRTAVAPPQQPQMQPPQMPPQAPPAPPQHFQPQAPPPGPGAPPPPPAAGPETEEETKAKGRPAKSFVMLVNCSPIRGMETRGDRKVYHGDKILQEVGADLAKAISEQQKLAQPLNYYDLDPFQRRDMIAKGAGAIAERIGNAMVTFNGIGTGASDLKTLCDALRPYAGMVIVADMH